MLRLIAAFLFMFEPGEILFFYYDYSKKVIIVSCYETQYQIALPLNIFIELLLKYSNSSIKNNRACLANKIGEIYKIPLVVANDLIFMPSASLSNERCIFIQYSAIKSYKALSRNKINVVFKNGKDYNFNVDLRTLKNMLSKVEKYLNNSLYLFQRLLNSINCYEVK